MIEMSRAAPPMPTTHLPASPGPPATQTGAVLPELSEDLRVAASRGQLELVGELFASGAGLEPDKDGRTALYYAAQEGHANTCHFLAARGCDLNKQDTMGYSPLLRAASQGARDVVQVLLEAGCDVNLQDENGNAALHEACWNGFSKAAELLVHHNCDVFIVNKAGFTALHLAAQNGHNESSRILLYAGCNPDIKNNYGDTALHTAARYGHAGVARILISARCKLSEQNKNGDSALHIAAALKRRKIAKILVESGIDIGLVNKQDETAMDVATRKEHPEIMLIITTYAKPRPQAGHSHHPAVTFKDEIEEMVDGPVGTPVDKPPEAANTRPEKEKKAGFFFSFKKKKKDKEKEKSSSTPTTPSSPSKQKQLDAAGGANGTATSADDKAKSSANRPTENKSAVHGFFSRYVPRDGMQFYRDLAGNIKQGPIGYAPVCQCGPSLRHLESALTSTKQSLHERIDASHHILSRRIEDIDLRTRPLARPTGGGGGYATDTVLHHRSHRDHYHHHSHHNYHPLQRQQHHHHHGHHHSFRKDDAMDDDDYDDFSGDEREGDFDDDNSMDLGLGSRDGRSRDDVSDQTMPEDLENWLSDKLASYGHCLNHHHDDTALPPRNLFADFSMGRLVRSRSDETLSVSDYSGKFRKRDFYASRQAAMQQIRGWELPPSVGEGGGGRTSRKDRAIAAKQHMLATTTAGGRSKSNSNRNTSATVDDNADFGGKRVVTQVQVHNHTDSSERSSKGQHHHNIASQGRQGPYVLNSSTNPTTSPRPVDVKLMLTNVQPVSSSRDHPERDTRDPSNGPLKEFPIQQINGGLKDRDTIYPGQTALVSQEKNNPNRQQHHQQALASARLSTPPYPSPPQYHQHQPQKQELRHTHEHYATPHDQSRVPPQIAPKPVLTRYQDNYGIHYNRSKTLSTEILNEDNGENVERPHPQPMPRSRSVDNTLEDIQPRGQWSSPHSSGYATDTAARPATSQAGFSPRGINSQRNNTRDSQSLSPAPRVTARYRLPETSHIQNTNSIAQPQRDARNSPAISSGALTDRSKRTSDSPRQASNLATCSHDASVPSDQAYESDRAPSDHTSPSPHSPSPGLNPMRECLQHDSSLLSARLTSTITSPNGITAKEDSTCSSNQDSGYGQDPRRGQERRGRTAADTSMGTPSSSFSMERSNTPSTTGSPYASQRGQHLTVPLQSRINNLQENLSASQTYSPLSTCSGPNGSFRSSSSESHKPDEIFSYHRPNSGQRGSGHYSDPQQRFPSPLSHLSSNKDGPAFRGSRNSGLSHLSYEQNKTLTTHSPLQGNSSHDSSTNQPRTSNSASFNATNHGSAHSRLPQNNAGSHDYGSPLGQVNTNHNTIVSHNSYQNGINHQSRPIPPPRPNTINYGPPNPHPHRVSSPQNPPPYTPNRNKSPGPNSFQTEAPRPPPPLPPARVIYPPNSNNSLRQKGPASAQSGPITPSAVQAHVQGWYQKKLLEAAQRLRQSESYGNYANLETLDTVQRKQSVEASSTETNSSGGYRQSNTSYPSHQHNSGSSYNDAGSRASNYFNPYSVNSSSSASPSPEGLKSGSGYTSNRPTQFNNFNHTSSSASPSSYQTSSYSQNQRHYSPSQHQPHLNPKQYAHHAYNHQPDINDRFADVNVYSINSSDNNNTQQKHYTNNYVPKNHTPANPHHPQGAAAQTSQPVTSHPQNASTYPNQGFKGNPPNMSYRMENSNSNISNFTGQQPAPQYNSRQGSAPYYDHQNNNKPPQQNSTQLYRGSMRYDPIRGSDV